MTKEEILLHMHHMEKEKHLEGWGEWIVLKLMVKYMEVNTIKQDWKERAIERELRNRK